MSHLEEIEQTKNCRTVHKFDIVQRVEKRKTKKKSSEKLRKTKKMLINNTLW